MMGVATWTLTAMMEMFLRRLTRSMRACLLGDPMSLLLTSQLLAMGVEVREFSLVCFVFFRWGEGEGEEMCSHASIEISKL